ncbi:UDP-3-O-acyl-N-acetylglucosamine deacetylase [Halothermothrix orenii]|uniref:UDP-3-O-acyl-N-acetylglucosamine deacetylase n=1 Tax=Halothermothrix orenii (strain H 168 / OCM 544 / DSM 9562) TaxID=373903 RepID=B8CYY7_HALOH|nr:UDP-3-O-acyl-N-acetylglucosamine deacetylase [Halothermothrix orenii]ACL70506.1 UDP-3-O-(3-hydroxymyristoyl) N-acetylglucosamine deacetylase [Halothermothrix orenii H 168]
MFIDGNLQQTIEKPVKASGTALHTGKEVNVRFLPAGEDTGVVFKRVDLPDNPEIKAEPWQVVSTRRCTSIGLSKDSDSPKVHTIEHLMAALWALEIDNVIVEIDAPETPVMDGSALPYLKLLKKAGIRELSSPRKIWVIDEPVWVKRGHMYMVILPYDGFKISYTLDYDHKVIGTQFFEFDKGENSFEEEIAPARTFGFEREVEALHRRGLALGGSLENAVLIGDEDTVNPLRFSNEFVRHKILDVIGDMALNGFVSGHIITVRSGHSLHVELAQEINKKLIQESERV